MRTIVIVGAGFCGAAAAVQLMRHPPSGPVRVVLLNRSGLMARGVAYGTRTDRHVLNVPAGRMGALPDDEDGFLRFAREHDPRVTAGSFVSRQLYGHYLEAQLTEAARNVPAGCRFRSIVGEATQLRVNAGGNSAVLELDQGETLSVDRVLLALGNFPPAQPRVDAESRAFFRSPRYVSDPWRPDALRVTRPDEPVLAIGTGLTMLDVLLSLRDRGQTAPVIALSRRGLLPQPHRDLAAFPDYAALLPDLKPERGIAAMLRAVRDRIMAVTGRGGDWRDVIGALRSQTPGLWHALTPVQRARFLRHLRPFWDVHRHRCAPEAGAALTQALAAGQLRVIAGRLQSFDEQPDGVFVGYRPRGQPHTETLRVGSVINCTGPENDTRSLAEPLLAQLRGAGLAVPDALGLGWQVSDDYALVDAQGQPSRVLFYVGPFLRAQHWEATAVPELREHVQKAVAGLRRSLEGDPGIELGSLQFA